MITTDRNVWLGSHVTQKIKDDFRAEADRRKISMSALVFQVLSHWLEDAHLERLPEIRSNKRDIKFKKDAFETAMKPFEEDVPLPFENKE